jgi:hypothetical protein
MSPQVAEREETTRVQQKAFPITTTVPGYEGTRILTAFSGNTITASLYMMSFFAEYANHAVMANAGGGVSWGGTFYAGTDQYDPDFVASILAADKAEPEARFNNVVDMLDWLNRE